ncbi:MAG: pyrroloquinoline quinone biosynthesis protein PqqB [Vulcanimicrobiaceae bacterium]
MIVRVLGSAAGGGVPQWNCACANCTAARSGSAPRRTSSSFAVSATGDRWWLVNVSPDVATQIEAYAPLQPRAGRGTPIAGMLLTDANVDHLGGFAVLRQDGEHAFTVYSSETVRAIACAQEAFATFAAPPHRWEAISPGQRFALEPGLDVRVVAVAGLTPGYAGRRSLGDAVVAYEISDVESGESALFAPVFMEVTPDLLAAASESRVAFFDGSFWSDDELGDVGVPKAARSLGHAPVGGPDGSLARLATIVPGRGSRRFFAHLNNTNPLLDERSMQSQILRDAGFDVAWDGLEVIVGRR